MGISDRQAWEELLMLARAVKSIQQAKAMTDNAHKLIDLTERERVLTESLLQTIFKQQGERSYD